MRLISQPEKLRAQTLVTDTTSCHCLFSWNSSIEWEPLEIVLRARSCRGRLSAAKDSPVWSHSDRAIMNARKRTPLPIPVAISPSKQGRSGRMGEKERAWGMGRERERDQAQDQSLAHEPRPPVRWTAAWHRRQTHIARAVLLLRMDRFSSPESWSVRGRGISGDVENNTPVHDFTWHVY
jgi:hypothetical protein